LFLDLVTVIGQTVYQRKENAFTKLTRRPLVSELEIISIFQRPVIQRTKKNIFKTL